MTEAILLWIENTFTADPYWVTAIISVIPMIEVRGAITVGISLGINPWIAWLLSCASAIIVCPILLFLLKPILRLLKKVKIFKLLAEGLEDMFKSKAAKLEQDSDSSVCSEQKAKHRKMLGVFLFVAIPLPLTGVWTGSAVAAFLDLQYRYSVPAIIIGNIVSGFLITLLNIVLGEYSTIILIVLMVFVIVSIVSVCTAVIIKYKKKTSSQKEDEK